VIVSIHMPKNVAPAQRSNGQFLVNCWSTRGQHGKRGLDGTQHNPELSKIEKGDRAWSDENSVRLIIGGDPVFVPFAKTVSAPELLPSSPGSARGRPAWQALPAWGRSGSGRAARPWRSQAEPGNEQAPGTNAVRVSTRNTIPLSPIFTSPDRARSTPLYLYLRLCLYLCLCSGIRATVLP
jgi:hypothetical protein